MNFFTRCIVLWLLLITGTDATAVDRPNVVLIMADDIGVECLGCYGSSQYQTPNLDRLAASGMRFENAHSQPICTPSRVQIMTGIYNHRNYIRFGVLDPAATTFANLMRGAGYQTCIGGKWQLEGGLDAPKRFGFDQSCLWQLTRRPSRYPNPGLEIDGQEVDFKQGEFGPNVVSDYLCDFIRQPHESPFLVYYPMIAPHWPFVPTPDHSDWDPTMWRDKTSEPGGYKSPKYWDAMVRYTDKMVGKILDAVESSGHRDNTLIIWTGDNGTFKNITSSYRGRRVRGGKGTTLDTGTHVGFIASWPNVIHPGSVSDELVDFADVLPTLLDVSQTRPPRNLQIDGVSLLPTFRGQPRSKDYIYCWYHRDGDRDLAQQYVHNGRYKLYANGRFYDLLRDHEETIDLFNDVPTKHAQAALKELSYALQKHVAEAKRADPIQRIKQDQYPRIMD